MMWLRQLRLRGIVVHTSLRAARLSPGWPGHRQDRRQVGSGHDRRAYATLASRNGRLAPAQSSNGSSWLPSALQPSLGTTGIGLRPDVGPVSTAGGPERTCYGRRLETPLTGSASAFGLIDRHLRLARGRRYIPAMNVWRTGPGSAGGRERSRRRDPAQRRQRRSETGDAHQSRAETARAEDTYSPGVRCSGTGGFLLSASSASSSSNPKLFEVL